MTEENDKFDAELEEIRRKKTQTRLKQETEEKPQESIPWPESPMEVTDQNFDDIVKTYPVVVIDCWAPWCGPCQMVGPVIEELARDYRGKIAFGKLNVDVNHQTSGKYGIMSIPTLLMFKNGSLADQQVGAMPRAMLEPIIMKHL